MGWQTWAGSRLHFRALTLSLKTAKAAAPAPLSDYCLVWLGGSRVQARWLQRHSTAPLVTVDTPLSDLDGWGSLTLANSRPSLQYFLLGWV